MSSGAAVDAGRFPLPQVGQTDGLRALREAAMHHQGSQLVVLADAGAGTSRA
jgi:hypothetical protein